MHLERGRLPRARKLSAPGVSDGDCRGIDDVPVLDLRQEARQIDLWGAGIRQGGHELFEGCIEPAIEGGTGDSWSLTLPIRAQDIRLVHPTRRAGRDDHGAHQSPEVQLALPLHHPAWHAQSVDGLAWQNRLKHLAHVLACHVRSPSVRSLGCSPVHRLRGVDHAPTLASRHSKPAPGGENGLSGHTWCLSYRDVEELLFERGITVTYEASLLEQSRQELPSAHPPAGTRHPGVQIPQARAAPPLRLWSCRATPPPAPASVVCPGLPTRHAAQIRSMAGNNHPSHRSLRIPD
jgi:hypothetical protein